METKVRVKEVVTILKWETDNEEQEQCLKTVIKILNKDELEFALFHAIKLKNSILASLIKAQHNRIEM